MFYQERIIDGVLCSRDSPSGEWIPLTAKELTVRIQHLSTRLGERIDRQEEP